jgi:predicted choloylglycine hydrolase
MQISVVQCRGTSYEIGRQQARAFAATRRGKSFLSRKKVAIPQWLNLATEEKFYTRFSPAIWQEIHGLADELNISIERACFVFGNGSIPPRLGGCSSLMTSNVFARNYDFRPANYGARLALIQPFGSYASIGFSERLTGRLDGMNEHGLSVALHLVAARPLNFGMSCILIVRLALDQCSTTEEAVELFRRVPHAMRYNFSVLDAQGRAAVVEAAPNAFAVRRGEWLVCTNHFQSASMRSLNRPHRTLWSRLPALQGWAEDSFSANSLFEMFNKSTSPVFYGERTHGRSVTLHTIVTEPKRRMVRIGIGGDAMQFPAAFQQLDFLPWVRGADLNFEEMAGQLGGKSKPFDWPATRTRKAAAKQRS